jgi:hypothetical protein
MRFVSSALLVLAVAACGGRSTEPAERFQWQGTWTLTSVNGQPLPATVPSGLSTFQFVSETFRLDTDNVGYSDMVLVIDGHTNNWSTRLDRTLVVGDDLTAESTIWDQFRIFHHEADGTLSSQDAGFVRVYKRTR